jgi:hypothetical protein
LICDFEPKASAGVHFDPRTWHSEAAQVHSPTQNANAHPVPRLELRKSLAASSTRDTSAPCQPRCICKPVEGITTTPTAIVTHWYGRAAYRMVKPLRKLDSRQDARISTTIMLMPPFAWR